MFGIVVIIAIVCLFIGLVELNTEVTVADTVIITSGPINILVYLNRTRIRYYRDQNECVPQKR